MEQIQKEIDYAGEIFKKNRRWPIVNVTDRALEETAAEVARIVSARFGKPMVAFKVGRSEAGARSASSHTGALAGRWGSVESITCCVIPRWHHLPVW